mgnify:CR=1 FL=1
MVEIIQYIHPSFLEGEDALNRFEDYVTKYGLDRVLLVSWMWGHPQHPDIQRLSSRLRKFVKVSANIQPLSHPSVKLPYVSTPPRNWRFQRNLNGEDIPYCICPNDEEAVKSLEKAIKQLSLEFEELILDDDTSLRGGCFCDLCLNRFKEEYGISKEELLKAIETFDRSILRKWAEFKCRSIEELLRRVASVAKKENPKAKVGIMCMVMAGPYHGIKPSSIGRIVDIMRVGEGFFSGEVFRGDGQILEYLSIHYFMSELRASGSNVKILSETTHEPIGSLTKAEFLKKAYMALSLGIKNIVIADGWIYDWTIPNNGLRILSEHRDMLDAVGRLLPEAPAKPLGALAVWFPIKEYFYAEEVGGVKWAGRLEAGYKRHFSDQNKTGIWRWITPLLIKANLPVIVATNSKDLEEAPLRAYFNEEFEKPEEPALMLGRALLKFGGKLITPVYELLDSTFEVNQGLPEKLEFTPRGEGAYALPLEDTVACRFIDENKDEYGSLVFKGRLALLGYDYFLNPKLASRSDVLSRINKIAYHLADIPVKISGAWNIAPSLYEIEGGYALSLINFNAAKVRVNVSIKVGERVTRITRLPSEEIRFTKDGGKVEFNLEIKGDDAAFLKLDVS